MGQQPKSLMLYLFRGQNLLVILKNEMNYFIEHLDILGGKMEIGLRVVMIIVSILGESGLMN
jgi:hypothetical protein